MNGRAGLYIHIPFCKTKCPYCDFYSITRRSRETALTGALIAEYESRRPAFKTFDTVYIGGGTPSVLGYGSLERLASAVRESGAVAADSEITIEVNPDDIRTMNLSGLRSLGFNRISLGAQSIRPALLKTLGRRHTALDVFAAIESIRSAGFDNLAIDLMYCIPGQGISGWIRDLEKISGMGLEHVSCYQLTVHDGTKFQKLVSGGCLKIPCERVQQAFFLATSRTLTACGYHHYEVSNFARDPSLVSRHNTKYWEHVPYLGLGPSAHSFLDRERWWNHRSLSRYLSDLSEERMPVSGRENLTETNLRNERIFLGLRTARGVLLDDILLSADARIQIGTICREGLGAISGGRLILNPRGWAVADRLAVLLIEPGS